MPNARALSRALATTAACLVSSAALAVPILDPTAFTSLGALPAGSAVWSAMPTGHSTSRADSPRIASMSRDSTGSASSTRSTRRSRPANSESATISTTTPASLRPRKGTKTRHPMRVSLASAGDNA